MEEIINCTECGKRFTARATSQIRCPDCQRKAVRQRNKEYQKAVHQARLKIAVCEYCGKEFKQTRTNQIYCSRKCYSNMSRPSPEYDIIPKEKPKPPPAYSIDDIIAFQNAYKAKEGKWIGYPEAAELIKKC